MSTVFLKLYTKALPVQNAPKVAPKYSKYCLGANGALALLKAWKNSSTISMGSPDRFCNKMVYMAVYEHNMMVGYTGEGATGVLRVGLTRSWRLAFTPDWHVIQLGTGEIPAVSLLFPAPAGASYGRNLWSAVWTCIKKPPCCIGTHYWVISML